MSGNPSDPPLGTPKSPPTTSPPQAAGNGKPKKPPARNGAGQPPKGWDSLRDPELDKKNDVELSKSKE
ncbi:uncharacterized protein PV06_09731 [Exophiala oligosperma]|uniref:Uncharacterized protein n=1 Tax=Exophiala oligosperma TaxID=215243 RepID=A0A0D2D5Q6_9EURO|nr:uncharacterized protein PV06_09731 [Exophiala oligosperma]KIW37735.1 hypothetical protein PV06_09731 [Exophiala oligosperma]